MNKYNAEGYADPTVYEALTHMEAERRAKAFRPLVYITSAVAADTQTNLKNARRVCRFAVEAGFLPLAPQLLFPQFMNDDIPQERDLARFMGMVLLTKCAELWVFGTQTAGMKAEVAKAKRKQMKVRTFTDGMEEQG